MTKKTQNLLAAGLLLITTALWSQQLPEFGGTGTRIRFTAGSIPFADAVGFYAQDNTNFAYNSSTHVVTALGGLTSTGAIGGAGATFSGASATLTGAVGGTGSTHTGASITLTGAASAASYATATNCASSASPAVCGSAAAGRVAGAAATTTLTINTTAVTANSEIFITEDSSLGTALSVTCNTTPSTNGITVTTRTAATSFAVLFSSPTTNPRCFSWRVLN